MKTSTLPFALALAAALLADARAAEPAGAPGRVTISMLASNTEVAALMLPIGVRPTFDVSAIHIDDGGKAGLHATGHVRLSFSLPNLPPLTLLGDELFIRREILDADKLKAIRDLEAMGASDQSIRAKGQDMTEADMTRQQALDVVNMKRLDEIIARYGWPGLRFAGAQGAQNAFLVLQHSNKASQQKYLPLFRDAVAKNDAAPSELALLEDRVRIQNGQAQLYGSQVKGGPPPELFPIEDEAHVDARRQAIGLGPLAEYAKQFGISYHPK